MAKKKSVRKKARRKKPKRSSRSKRNKKPMAKKKSRGGRAKSGIKNILKSGAVGKVVLGVGAATVVGLAVDRFAPQFAPIARPIAAFLAGGPIGAIASVVLGGTGFNLSNILGGGAPTGTGEAI